MRLNTLTLAGLLVAVACGGAEEADNTARDLNLAPADSVSALDDAPAEQAPTTGQREPAPPARQPAPRPAERRTPPLPPPGLEPGVSFTIYAVDTLTSRHNKIGDTVRAVILDPVTDDAGRTIIPDNAIFLGTITDVAPAESPGGEGRMVISYNQVLIDGELHAMTSVTDSIGTRMKGRGITAGDAAKVGAGTVIGAVAGRIIGGNRTGTIVGAAAGTAAGAGIAAATRDVDIILDAGAPVFVTLTERFTVGD